MMMQAVKRIAPWFAISVLMLLLFPGIACAQQQFTGVCARVKIEILQELTLERIGFLATLEITNNESEAPITDFSAILTFENPALSEEGNPDDASALFFVQPPELKNINDIDGTGVIPATKNAVIEWFIIPEIAAGGTDASGIRYRIGASLAGSLYGQEIDPDILEVIPDMIVVKPEPQLEITYFQPRDVTGDNPFTVEVIESPIPFILGVLVKNVGYGLARDVKIASQQPRIVENKEGLILIAQLLGSRVDDELTDETSLTVNLGDIEPASCRKGAWDMITSLSGEFIEFKASFTHASELGGEETSIITSMNAYFIAHEVLNDQPGRDDLLDFLADTDNDVAMLPDTLFESNCNTLPVNQLTDLSVQGDSFTASVTVNADREGWVYMRMDDPGQAKYPIANVTRSDGKLLNPHNYWTNIRYERSTNKKLTYLNIFDFVALGDYEYMVSYAQIGEDNDPPETRIRFSGPMQEFENIYYILPETQVYFTVEDESTVATYYRLDAEGSFMPAYPFNINTGGQHSIEYYSRDSAGNEEAYKTASVFVSADFPGIQIFTADYNQIFISGSGYSVRPASMNVNFQGVVNSSRLDAEIDIFQGVLGWVTLSGIPSSPTPDPDAVIIVGGENVDYYKYRIGQGTWSSECPVGIPIQLSGLPEGTVDLYVKGRSRYGTYLSEEYAVKVSWIVDANAPETVITGTPPTPSRSTEGQFEISGGDLYRYSLDGDYYHPETGISEPIVLTGLEEEAHTLSVICKKGGQAWQEEDKATTVNWVVDRGYGFNFSSLNRVRHVDFIDVGSSMISFEWDGKDDQGAFVTSGWYTIRLTIKDELERLTYAVQLVQIENTITEEMPLSGTGSAIQKNVHAFGGLVVWQDQRNGDWDIYAKGLMRGEEIAITDTPLNQENPQTDGRYVVWEDRQANGNWDIWAKDIDSNQNIFPVTETTGYDERKPVVFWPWVVYQTKPVTDPDAPWQLMSYNMITQTEEAVDPTNQDQLDPAIYKQKIVWQDFRDPGWGEIYLKDIKTGEVIRITEDTDSQYHPAISENWIIWSDKRNIQNDLYGFNLLSNAEVRLTDSQENETRPSMNGKWVVYEEDSCGVLKINLRIFDLYTLSCMQLTNFDSEKKNPYLTNGKLIWEDKGSGISQVMIANIPNLQPVFNNQNLVAVTEGMATYQKDAFTLLALWKEQAGVNSITRYTAIVPEPVSETIILENGQPVGNNFDLVSGTFLWVKFDQANVLDLGEGGCDSIDLAPGVNVFSYCCFPDDYTAYKLIREILVDNIKAVRSLDSGTGKWLTASVIDGNIVGEDFYIPRIATLMIDMKTQIIQWRPGE